MKKRGAPSENLAYKTPVSTNEQKTRRAEAPLSNAMDYADLTFQFPAAKSWPLRVNHSNPRRF